MKGDFSNDSHLVTSDEQHGYMDEFPKQKHLILNILDKWGDTIKKVD